MTNVNVNLEVENPVTSKELIELALLHIIRKQPIMVWGDSGIGKSEVVHQIGAHLGARVFPFHTNIREPVDVRGIPVPDLETGTTRWFVPSELPKSDGSDGPSVLFLDEINNGTIQMLAVCMQLVLDRRVGDYVVPDNCAIIAAGNRSKDSRAVVQMPKPLRNRFAHYTMIVDLDAWCDHAKRTGLAPELIAFARFRSGVTNADGTKGILLRNPTGEVNSYPSPRTLYKCGDYVNEPPRLRSKAFNALIGKDAGSELESFCAMYQALTNLDDVLKNPKTAVVPTEPSEQYAVATALARLATRQNFANVITYSDRLPADIGALCVTDATDRDDKLKNVAAYGKWAVNNSHMSLQ